MINKNCVYQLRRRQFKFCHRKTFEANDAPTMGQRSKRLLMSFKLSTVVKFKLSKSPLINQNS